MGNLEHNLTEGSVIKNLILFSLPFVGSFVLQSLYSTVDLFIVSHYAGTYSISGLNIVAQITDLVLGIAIGLLSAATVMIAQYVGAGKEKEIHKTIETTFTLVIILAVIMTIGMQIFMNPILHILQTPLESYQEASNYYRVVISGILFTFMYNAIANILRGMGDSKNPLYFVIISTGINIILDIIFVGKMHMGAGGAALATVIAQMCSVLVSIIYLRKIDFPFDFKLSSFHIDQEKIKNRNSFCFSEFYVEFFIGCFDCSSKSSGSICICCSWNCSEDKCNFYFASNSIACSSVSNRWTKCGSRKVKTGRKNSDSRVDYFFFI